MVLGHYNDGKEKWQSHEVYLGYELLGKISEFDVGEDSLRGYGSTK